MLWVAALGTTTLTTPIGHSTILADMRLTAVAAEVSIMSNKAPNDQETKSRFPLSLHRTGQWYKKIRGEFFYSGADKDEAHRRYLEVAAALHAGHTNAVPGPGGEHSLTFRNIVRR
jgi:hypothetical protein